MFMTLGDLLETMVNQFIMVMTGATVLHTLIAWMIIVGFIAMIIANVLEEWKR